MAIVSVIRPMPFGDGLGVPLASVLLRERDQGTVRSGTRRAASVGQQHECEEPGHLAVVWQAIVKLPGQPDRLAGESLTGGARTGQVLTVEAPAPGVGWP